MEDVEAQAGQPAYTDREKDLSEWFNVDPELIRALTDVVERIREKNVIRPTNGLIYERSQTARFHTDWRNSRVL